MKTVGITSKINGFKRSLKENNERKMAFFCRPQDRCWAKDFLKSHKNSPSDRFHKLNSFQTLNSLIEWEICKCLTKIEEWRFYQQLNDHIRVTGVVLYSVNILIWQEKNLINKNSRMRNWQRLLQTFLFKS